ncbi:UBP34-like protein, partial [Mya arenaria]
VCGTSNSESEAGQSRGLAGGTFLDNTEFFHQYSGNVDSQSIHSESGPGHIEITTNIESASFSQQTTSNAMSYIRRSYEKRNLSKKSINIIMASWRKTTQKQYSTYINRWIHFCREREIDPLQTPIEYCIEFLTELYDSGLSYETLNTARSALSNGYNVESHPFVIRFLSGVYNLPPTKPKYKETWDVSKVLCYLKTLTPARQLSLKMLSYKLVMLIALTQASQSHSISLLTLDNMMKDSESYVLHYSGLLKQSRKGKVNPILKLNRYTLDSEICVYSTIAECIEQTSGLRNGVRQLIISYIKPHKPVVSTTISRWIKFVLKSSGIDIDKYSSHSTRSAASSKVKASGLPISEIMKVAGWSTDTTFARSYDKPLERESCCSFQDESEHKAYNLRGFCKVYTMDKQPLNTGEQKDMTEFFTDLITKLEEMSPDMDLLAETVRCHFQEVWGPHPERRDEVEDYSEKILHYE